jgi:hypothetical protein
VGARTRWGVPLIESFLWLISRVEDPLFVGILAGHWLTLRAANFFSPFSKSQSMNFWVQV